MAVRGRDQRVRAYRAQHHARRAGATRTSTSSRSTISPTPTTLAHLLKYDSVLGNLDADVKATSDGITVDGDEFKVLSVKDPAQLPWKDLGVDVVFECTGIFTGRDGAAKHLDGRREEGDHHRAGQRARHHRRARRQRRQVRPGEAPDHLERVVHDELPGAAGQGASTSSSASRKAWMTTIHSYTNDQNLLDLPHKDLRRARAAALSMIPTTHRRGDGGRRGAARAQGQARRHRDARADAERLGRRSERRARQEDDRRGGQRRAARGGGRPAQGHPRRVATSELVSIDFRGNPHSSIVDAPYTKVMDGDFVKVLSWYDNEWGYSSRCVDLLQKLVAARAVTA